MGCLWIWAARTFFVPVLVGGHSDVQLLSCVRGLVQGLVTPACRAGVHAPLSWGVGGLRGGWGGSVAPTLALPG